MKLKLKLNISPIKYLEYLGCIDFLWLYFELDINGSNSNFFNLIAFVNNLSISKVILLEKDAVALVFVIKLEKMNETLTLDHDDIFIYFPF